jgi:hypothetical protein
MTTANSAGFLSEMVIAEEVDKGSTPAITTGLRDYFTGNPAIDAVQNVIRLGNVQHRHTVSHVLSSYHMTGSIPQIVTPNGHIGYWLGGAIGDPDSNQQGGTAAYKHTYAPDDDLKTYSMWFKRGGNQQVVIPYVVVNTLELVQGVDDVLRANVGIFGQKETINADDFTTADAYDTAAPFHNMDLTVTGPTNAAQVYSSRILIENAYAVDRGKVHGSRFYTAMVPGKRNVTGSVELWFDDDGDYQSFWGSTSDTTPDVDGVHSTVAMTFTWDTDEEADTGYDYALVLTLPEVVFESTTVSIEDRIRQTINFSAQYDTGDAYEIQAELTNVVPTYP